MVIHTEGEPSAPAVLLLHPMLFSGEQMAAGLGRRLPGSHYLIFPDQSGHGEDQGEFVSPEQEALELHRWLTGQGIEEIRLLCAASLGGVTAMELMKLGGLRYHAVHMDGVPLGKQDGIQSQLALTGFLRIHKKAQKDPSSAVGMISRLYGEKLGKTMAQQLGALSQDSVRRILKACLSGCAVPLDEERVGRLTFEWGEKDPSLGKAKPVAEKLYPRARILIRPGLNHCEYLGRKPGAYAKELVPELEE